MILMDKLKFKFIIYLNMSLTEEAIKAKPKKPLNGFFKLREKRMVDYQEGREGTDFKAFGAKVKAEWDKITEKEKEKMSAEFKKDLTKWEEDFEKWKKKFNLTDEEAKAKISKKKTKNKKKDDEITKPEKSKAQKSKEKEKKK